MIDTKHANNTPIRTRVIMQAPPLPFGCTPGSVVRPDLQEHAIGTLREAVDVDALDTLNGGPHVTQDTCTSDSRDTETNCEL
jgi:hypothetical protein